MIWTVVRIGLLRLRHGKVELVLTFIVPIIFFTIFALIFDRQVGGGGTSRIRVALVDEDRSPRSNALVQALAEHETLRVHLPSQQPRDAVAFPQSGRAEALVRRGDLQLAIRIPPNWAESVTQPAGAGQKVQILADMSDPVAPQMVAAIVQQTIGHVLARAPVGPAGRRGAAAGQLPDPATREGPAVTVQDVLAEDKSNPVVSMYAAGIAVMFLMFTAAGNGGSLLEEEESQTLERLLCSSLTMNRLLIGKWLLLCLTGICQVVVMFSWAQLVFHVDLLGHLLGFALMTVFTAGAASSFALMLAAACRTRAQLNAVSVILILSMSALGGSMVPRYVMSETMQEVGMITFNAWALEGYMTIFWRDLPITNVWRELLALLCSGVIFAAIARVLARRWEKI